MRLRVAATHADRAQAERLAREVMALYTCGPAGGGGVRTALTPRLDTISCLLPREAVPARFAMVEEAPHEHARRSAAVPRRPRPHRRQGQPLQHQRDRLAPGALAAAGRAGHRSACRRAVRATAARARVQRYLLPKLHAMNFVLDDVLDGGVNDALNLDSHGKALSFLLLDLPIRVPRRTARPARRRRRRPDPSQLTFRRQDNEPLSPSPLAAALPLAAAARRCAQAYPDKPITFVVPFAAGSATDQLARALGKAITARDQAGGGRRQQGRRQRLHRGAAGGARRRPTATPC